jgi:hypothetical protein
MCNRPKPDPIRIQRSRRRFALVQETLLGGAICPQRNHHSIINGAYTPARSEEGCSRLSLFEVPLLVPRPCSVRVLQQISDFEPLCMQHVRSPTALYNSERWLARAPEKQSLPASSQVNSALIAPPKTPSFSNQYRWASDRARESSSAFNSVRPARRNVQRRTSGISSLGDVALAPDPEIFRHQFVSTTRAMVR